MREARERRDRDLTRERVVDGILYALGIEAVVGARIVGRGAIYGDVMVAPLLFYEADHSLAYRSVLACGGADFFLAMRGFVRVNNLLFEARLCQDAKIHLHVILNKSQSLSLGHYACICMETATFGTMTSPP